MSQRIPVEPPPEVPVDYGCASEMDEATKERAMMELRLRQLRLGTPYELPEDERRVCDLAHLLNNRLGLEILTAERDSRVLFS